MTSKKNSSHSSSFLIPSEDSQFYLDLSSENKSSSKYQKVWLKEFKQYLNQLFELIYSGKEEDTKKILKLCLKGDESFLNLAIRSFTDETENVINYEPLEFYGDVVYELSLSRFLYSIYNEDLRAKPEFYSKLQNYFKSNEYQEIMSSNLKLDKWLIKGDKDVNLTLKMKANVVESLFGTIDFITRGVKKILYNEGEYQLAAQSIFGPDACYLFLKRYFEIFGFRPEDGDKSTAVLFFGNLGDIFSERGKIFFNSVKGTNGNNIFNIVIKPDFIELLNREVGFDSEQLSLINKLYTYKNESKNDLAVSLKKIFTQKLGINDRWLEEYKDLAKLNSVPEPYKSELLTKVKGDEKWVNIKFEAPKTQRTPKEATVIMYKVKGDSKGNLLDKIILGIKTGKHEGSLFPYKLRDELVREYLERKGE